MVALLYLRSVLRSFRRAPGLVAASVLAIALGMTATGAVTTLVSAVALRPLPFPDAQRLVRVWLSGGGDQQPRTSLSIPDLEDLERDAGIFDAFLGTARSRVVGLLDRGAERLRGEGVTRDYFDALQLRPLRGRLLDPSDFAPGAAPVVVLSAGAWERLYGARPDVIGQPFRTEPVTYTIVGIAPRGFAGTVEDDVVEFWVPLPRYQPAALISRRDGRSAWAIARLQPGVTLGDAQSALDRRFGPLERRHGELYRGLRYRLEPMGENWRSQHRDASGMLSLAALGLLLIAAFNVAGLVAARAVRRTREFAVQRALGASPRRLIAVALGETALIAVAGGAAGLLAAPAVLDGFLSLSPVTIPHYVVLEPDATSLAIALAALAVAALVATVAPAFLIARTAPADVLRGGRTGSGERWERRATAALVMSEIAVTLPLLVCGALLLRSYQALVEVDPGHRVEGLVRLGITAGRLDVPDAAGLPAFFARLRTSMAEYPGVHDVGLVSTTLPPWRADVLRLHLPGSDVDDAPPTGAHLVDAHLLRTLGIRLLAGRPLTEADARVTPRPALVSPVVAGRFGGVPGVLGRQLQIAPHSDVADGPIVIVGVTAEAAYDGVAEQGSGRLLSGQQLHAAGDVYLPLDSERARTVSLAVRVDGDEAVMLERLTRRLAELAPRSAVHWTGTMAAELERERAGARFAATLTTTFSVSALVLTALGLCATLAHAVGRREAEFGLRAALGASPARLLRALGGLIVLPVAWGLALGLGASAGAARLAAGMLYVVTPADAPSLVLALTLLAAAGAAAAVWPAVRALRIDPARLMRTDA
jgi:putative ABC transport system permease protein